MDSDDKVFLKQISEKLDDFAAQTVGPIKEIRENIEKKIGPIHHVYPYTVEERLDMITEKIEIIGHDVFANKLLHAIIPENLVGRLDEMEATCGAIIHETEKLYERVTGFQHSFRERVPETLEERLDEIEFQLKSLTALVSLFCTHFGVNRPKPVGLPALKEKKEQKEEPED